VSAIGVPEDGEVYVPRRAARRSERQGPAGRIALTHWGAPDPSPIILLHGWMDCAAAWQLLVDQLPEDWPLLAIDWPGYGQSERHAQHYWFPEHLAELDWLLDEISPYQPARIIGHSMGGTVASMYAGVRPERIAWLVNMEGIGMPELPSEELPALIGGWLGASHTPPLARRYQDLEDLVVALRRANPCLPATHARFLAAVWTRPTQNGFEMLADPRHQLRTPMRYSRAELEACWARIRAPHLLLYGAESSHSRRVLGTDVPTELKKIMPALRIEPVSAAGHLMPHEQPEQVAQAIISFAATVP
jgi:pimeloyl-ACP methyl ester carboxylesterase